MNNIGRNNNKKRPRPTVKLSIACNRTLCNLMKLSMVEHTAHVIIHSRWRNSLKYADKTDNLEKT